MASDERRTTERLNALLTAGYFQKAGRVVDQYVAAIQQDHSATPTSAHTWFMLALTMRLTNNDTAADIYWQQARAMDDYDNTLAGDFLRDQMLATIRKHRLEVAESFVAKIKALHAGDDNRLAALKMAEAQLAFAHDDIPCALRQHAEADATWRALPESRRDEQWMRNNRFHWLKPLVAARANRATLYATLMSDEPCRDRRIRAWIMHRLGRPGLWIDRVVEYLIC